MGTIGAGAAAVVGMSVLRLCREAAPEIKSGGKVVVEDISQILRPAVPEILGGTERIGKTMIGDVAPNMAKQGGDELPAFAKLANSEAKANAAWQFQLLKKELPELTLSEFEKSLAESAALAEPPPLALLRGTAALKMRPGIVRVDDRPVLARIWLKASGVSDSALQAADKAGLLEWSDALTEYEALANARKIQEAAASPAGARNWVEAWAGYPTRATVRTMRTVAEWEACQALARESKQTSAKLQDLLSLYPSEQIWSDVVARELKESTSHSPLETEWKKLVDAAGDEQIELRPPPFHGPIGTQSVVQSPTQVAPILILPNLDHPEEYSALFGHLPSQAEADALQKVKDAFRKKFRLGQIVSTEWELRNAIERETGRRHAVIILGHSESLDPKDPAARSLKLIKRSFGNTTSALDRNERSMEVSASAIRESDVLVEASKRGTLGFVLTCFGEDLSVNAPIRFDDMIQMVTAVDGAVRTSAKSREEIRQIMRTTRTFEQRRRVAIRTLEVAGITGGVVEVAWLGRTRAPGTNPLFVSGPDSKPRSPEASRQRD